MEGGGGVNYVRGIRLREMPDEQSYLRNIPAIRHFSQMEGLEFRAPVTFLIGENGSGKSTFLEAIAVSMRFNPEGGSRDFSFSTRATHSELCDLITVIKTIPPKDGFFLRAESFYNTASYLDDTGSLMLRYGGVSFHAQSHGEAFMALVANRFEGNGLYLLDEPEAALSPQRQLSLIVEMGRLVRENSQFIIATHSPLLMAFPGAEIYQFSDAGIQKTAYRETDHYLITKRFLDAPEQMLHYLLEEA